MVFISVRTEVYREKSNSFYLIEFIAKRAIFKNPEALNYRDLKIKSRITIIQHITKCFRILFDSGKLRREKDTK